MLLSLRLLHNGLLLRDSAHPLKQYLPTSIINLQTAAEQLYKDSHICTRNIIKHLFGIWKRRIPILTLGMWYCLQRGLSIIVATAVLHNIARHHNNDAEPDIDPDLNLPMPWEEILAECDIHHRYTNSTRIDS